MPASRAPLAAGRWHFQQGPIDCVLGAEGPGAAAAHEVAWARFATVLDELVAELAQLRRPVQEATGVQGAIARRMVQACAPYAAGFITPMAAVAGAVAQELIACYDRPGVNRAWVNNGGDIALHLAPGSAVGVGLVSDLARIGLDADFTVHAHQPVRGVATSGWRGRSFSLGIADSVTVWARSAAAADAAATVVANAVDIDHPAIRRRPACELRDDTDLGSRRVTVHVPALPVADVQQALDRGARRAQALVAQGLIEGALMVCQGQVTAAGGATAGVTVRGVSAVAGPALSLSAQAQPLHGPLLALEA
jgi:ApbE superfamily uncharacterized protein (UPF0280 family)